MRSGLPYKFTVPPTLTNRSLVGVGEAAHGSGGLHDLAAGLIESLIVQSDVRKILFEAPYGSVAPINDLIQRSNLVTARDLAGLYPIWRSKENLAFFNRLSSLNETLAKPVEIIGIDIRQPFLELSELGAYAPALLKEFPVQPEINAFRKFEAAVLKKAFTFESSLSSRLTMILEKLALALALDKSLNASRTSELSFFVTKIKSWVDTYRAFSVHENFNPGLVARDHGMYKSVKNYLSDSPVVIWAHLGHLIFDSEKVNSKTDIFKMGPLLGTLLKRDLADNFSTVALLAQETSIRGQDGRTITFQALPTTLEGKALDAHESLIFLSPEDLRGYGTLSIADSDHRDDDFKSMYPDLEVTGTSQFDHALIIRQSNAIDELVL